MRHNTVRRSLIVTYSFIILVSFTALALLFGAIQAPMLKEQTFSTLEQHTVSVAASVDAEIDQMRTIALNISYSTMIQDNFFHEDDTTPERFMHSSSAENLSTLLSALIFPNRPVDQINLYSLDGAMVASGLENTVRRQFAVDLPWFQALSDAPNSQLIFFSGTDPRISKFHTSTYGKQFISLVMENYDLFNNICGYIEIKQRLSSILSSAINYKASYGEQIYVFDKSGALLFPQDLTAPDHLFDIASENGFPQDFQKLPSEQHQQHYICASVDKGNFYTIMVVSEQTLSAPVREFVSNIIIITIATLFVSLAMSYLASRRITKPIDDICRQISSIDIEHPAALPPLKTELTELKTLHESFDQMQSTLSEHVGKLLMLQNQEMQSRMLALQSQMNPHFLFNSLAAIQAMADEGMDEEIAIMCQSMANILRYISSDSSQEVPLEDEIRYTTDYLICMGIRYQGDLSYEINVPDTMQSIQVPKLCLQLLVENAIKFTTAKRPPYHIQIIGQLDSQHYELRIRDNGPGFAQDTLDMLYEKMAEIRETSMLPSLKINGMGILNVYIRYCLLHENQFIFRLENNPDGGASVVIGVNFNEPEN